MSQKGKVQLAFVITAPPDQVAEGDRLFKSHAPWMEGDPPPGHSLMTATRTGE